MTSYTGNTREPGRLTQKVEDDKIQIISVLTGRKFGLQESDNMRKFMVAVCQMDSQNDKEENLQMAGKMIAEAAGKGARLVALPEMMNFMGEGYCEQAETIPGHTADFLCAKAKEHNVWVVSGSFPEETGSGNPKNTLLLIDPKGSICCKYSKLHMFDVELNGVSYCESAQNMAGNEIVLADTELGRIGFAICYDLRFGEMFRIMALQGAQIICIPSSFTLESGKDHWEALLRARAIENGVYMIAPNQIGKKSSMNAYGNSMVVNPWGTVIARAGEQPCCVMAEIDLDYVDHVRKQVPALQNRREDVYHIESGKVKIY